MNRKELLLKALKKAKELYRPAGPPVIFDLQIEAEILGCVRRWHGLSKED